MNRTEHESELLNKGYKLIAGIDEVGRGPLAGPFVVGAVVFDVEKLLIGNITNNDIMSVNDSKKLTERKRRHLNEIIRKEAIAYSLIEVSAQELDKMGLTAATQYAFFEALKKLQVQPDFVLTDAVRIKALADSTQRNIIHGDGLSLTIGAASIIAKVHRDAIMTEMHTKYPQYAFDKHKGYGTKAHIQAIMTHGVCEEHRKSFEPIKTLLEARKPS